MSFPETSEAQVSKRLPTALLAWHFLADNGRLRDGRPAPADGKWLKHSGPVAMCESGLHASRRALDALQYAPGALVCRVEVRGVVEEHGDKLVATERKILWRVDATALLRDFARRCALDAVEAHWKDAPEIVLRFLRTGDPEIRDAAWAAARDAAGDAAWAPARAAARDAAWAAAWAAARAPAWAAARDAAGDAAWAAAGDAQNHNLETWLTLEHNRTLGR